MNLASSPHFDSAAIARSSARLSATALSSHAQSIPNNNFYSPEKATIHRAAGIMLPDV
jgi:hypothetical protein